MKEQLTGLMLRKAACEALGWKIENSYRGGWRWWVKNPDGKDVLSSNETDILGVVERSMPAIESDPAVSEPMFLEWCEKNEYDFDLRFHGGSDRPFDIVLWARPRQGRVMILNYAGSTPSEARARAIVAAEKVR